MDSLGCLRTIQDVIGGPSTSVFGDSGCTIGGGLSIPLSLEFSGKRNEELSMVRWHWIEGMLLGIELDTERRWFSLNFLIVKFVIDYNNKDTYGY